MTAPPFAPAVSNSLIVPDNGAHKVALFSLREKTIPPKEVG
jgi:hypothetical protein